MLLQHHTETYRSLQYTIDTKFVLQLINKKVTPESWTFTSLVSSVPTHAPSHPLISGVLQSFHSAAATSVCNTNDEGNSLCTSTAGLIRRFNNKGRQREVIVWFPGYQVANNCAANSSLRGEAVGGISIQEMERLVELVFLLRPRCLSKGWIWKRRQLWTVSRH